MRKKFFIWLLATVFLTTISLAQAQQPKKVARICYLGGTVANSPYNFNPFRERLRELGYIEGQNITIEIRPHEGKVERLPELAAELVRLNCDVIVANGTDAALTAKSSIKTIPVVMGFSTDAVRLGIVASLARPGGNITGLSFDVSQDILGKNVATLKEIVPKLSRVGVLRQVESGTSFAALEAAARKLGVTLEVADIGTPDDFEGAFATLIGKRAGALIVVGGPLTYMRRQQIADLALKNRLPGIHSLREYAQAGLLISYGPNLPDLYRRAAGYVAKILRGAKPADLPVDQPATFELIINLKTAKALGLTIPQSLLARADELIR